MEEMLKRDLDSIKVVQNSWVDNFNLNKVASESEKSLAQVFIVLKSEGSTKWFEKYLLPQQLEQLKTNTSFFQSFSTENGPIYVVYPKRLLTQPGNSSQLKGDLYGCCRDTMGALYVSLKKDSVKVVNLIANSNADAAIQGILVGLEMANYTYKSCIDLSKKPANKLKSTFLDPSFEVYFSCEKDKVSSTSFKKAKALGVSINIARHLVNFPSNILNPESYTDLVKKLFTGRKEVQVKVWSESQLKKENMGLMLAVGQGAEYPARLVHIRYRPTKSTKNAPIAFVGKGITFDSGGLDIKPSAGMRLMKKDMGGSASVVGLANFITEIGFNRGFDFYLAIAENAISGNSFRPGDVLHSRSGQTVEIHNTDAEGRLVLADALDVAVSASGVHQPAHVINVATLTGAIKVGLGADIAGLFSNDDKLASGLEASSRFTTDRVWRMPLFDGYQSSLKSSFADIANCTNGFGGAINAALFLQMFVKEASWAHLDIYAWNDSPKGSLLETGGSGQGVQLLAHWVQSL